jgi:carbon storage regulator
MSLFVLFGGNRQSITHPRQGAVAMLVLSRKTGERVKIGEDIEVIVQEIHRGRVKLAFQAPSETHIVRTELTYEGGEHEDASSSVLR